MLDRMAGLVLQLRTKFARARGSTGYRILLGALSFGLLAACAWFIWRQVSDSYAAVAESGLHLEMQSLVTSWILVTAATALGAWEWVLLVRALGGRIDLTDGLSIHLTSNLAKYIPGFIWSYTGKSILAVRHGVPASIATLSIAAEFVIVYVCGALLALLSIPYSDIISLPTGGRVGLEIIGLCVAVLVFAGLPRLAQQLTAQAEPARALPRRLSNANWSKVAVVAFAVFMTWCLLAFGFGVLYGQPRSGGWSHLLRHAVALVGALLLGQIAFFAPTGVGVREAVLVALLTIERNAAEVLILAVVFRLEMIVGEIVCALVALAAVRIGRARRAHSRSDNTNG